MITKTETHKAEMIVRLPPGVHTTRSTYNPDALIIVATAGNAAEAEAKIMETVRSIMLASCEIGVEDDPA